MIEVAAAAKAPSSSSTWITILVAFLGLSGTIGAVMVKDWLERRKEKKNMAIGAYFRISHEIYKTLASTIRMLGAERAMIIRSENGGGIPKPGSQIYLSVVYETFDKPLESCRDLFQRYPADAQYIGLLDEVFHKGQAFIEPDLMEAGFLRDYYRSVDIKATEVIRLYASDDRFVYLAINFQRSKPDRDDPKYRETIRFATHQLKSLINDVKELTDT